MKITASDAIWTILFGLACLAVLWWDKRRNGGDDHRNGGR